MTSAGGPPPSTDEIRAARQLLDRAERVLVLTGAGMSAESGVPTFRGSDGLWKNHRPEELATPQAFARDPRLVWEWYGWRRDLVRECSPNAGHRALARWAASRDGVSIVTQNVDGLHEAAAAEVAAEAGAVGPDPLRLHGSIFRARCTECAEEDTHDCPVDTRERGTLPHCGHCGGLLRPAVVWFGEGLDPATLDTAFRTAGEAGVCLVAGTSAVVQPVASIPLATLRSGGQIVEVNPARTPLTHMASHVLNGPSGILLPDLLAVPG